jgi:hypothetical protein
MSSVLATALLLSIGASTAHAQHTWQRGAGVFVGAHAMRIQQPADGAALGVALGYNIGGRFAVLIDVDLGGARVNDSTRMIGHADIAARVYPIAIGPVTPFLEAAFTSQQLERPPADLLHTGFTAGGGMELFFSATRSLVALVRRTSFDQQPTYRVSLGVHLRPPR